MMLAMMQRRVSEDFNYKVTVFLEFHTQLHLKKKKRERGMGRCPQKRCNGTIYAHRPPEWNVPGNLGGVFFGQAAKNHHGILDKDFIPAPSPRSKPWV